MMILCEDWKNIPYNKALEKKLKILESMKENSKADKLIFCSHPPIVTLGRSSQKGDVLAWPGEICSVSRGGKTTYHGPDQLMIYPIVDMRKKRKSLRPKDLPAYLRLLENVLIQSLREFHLFSYSKSALRQKKNSKNKKKEFQNETGVWVEDKKIASIGVAFKHWISYHGAAINLEKDPQAFLGIRPCGFSSSTMISVEEVLGKKIDRKEFQFAFKDIFLYEFQEK